MRRGAVLLRPFWVSQTRAQQDCAPTQAATTFFEMLYGCGRSVTTARRRADIKSAIEPQRSQRPQRRSQGFMASEYFIPQGNDCEKGIIPKLFSLSGCVLCGKIQLRFLGSSLCLQHRKLNAHGVTRSTGTGMFWMQGIPRWNPHSAAG
jgi:hypothetical protein